MLKNRNSFFSQSSMNYQNTYPTPIPQMEQGSQSNTYYQGPIPQNNYQNTYQDDYEARIAKLERAINRLDARVTALENAQDTSLNTISNSMYMV